MKHAKLIASILAITCLLPLSGCRQTDDSSDNPFGMSASDKGGSDLDTGFEPGTSNGEKRLYGKDSSLLIKFNEMMIELGTANQLYYYSINDIADKQILCFDPLCQHLPQQESCSAEINLYLTEVLPDGSHGPSYPWYMYLDCYEGSDSPVIYFAYRRDDFYAVNLEETGTREPVYCIERYDISQGRRYTVLDNIQYTVEQMCNYGDYIYYVLNRGEDEGQKLYRVSKAGGKSDSLDLGVKADNIEMIEAASDKLYYVVDSQYIYRCNLDLTGSEQVLDMGEVKGANGSNGVVAGAYGGYLYYFADTETVYSKSDNEGYSGQKCNLYRMPMNVLGGTPELVVENMLYRLDCYRFTESVLYYEPCVFKQADPSEQTDSERLYTSVNLSDGTLMALDLDTLESKAIVENSGMDIYLNFVYEDCVLFAGWAYNDSGLDYSGDDENLLIAYSSGEPFKYLCLKVQIG